MPTKLYLDKMKQADRVMLTVQFKDGEMYIKTKDGKCCFLVDNMCSIYEDRPQVCRDYGVNPSSPATRCPYLKSDGTKRTKRETEIVKATTKRELKKAIEKAKKDSKLAKTNS